MVQTKITMLIYAITITLAVVIVVTSISALTAISPETRSAKNDVNIAASKLVDVCLDTLPYGTASCDNELKTKIDEVCAIDRSFDVCIDGRVEYYYQVRAAINGSTITITKQDNNLTDKPEHIENEQLNNYMTNFYSPELMQCARMIPSLESYDPHSMSYQVEHCDWIIGDLGRSCEQLNQYRIDICQDPRIEQYFEARNKSLRNNFDARYLGQVSEIPDAERVARLGDIMTIDDVSFNVTLSNPLSAEINLHVINNGDRHVELSGYDIAIIQPDGSLYAGSLESVALTCKNEENHEYIGGDEATYSYGCNTKAYGTSYFPYSLKMPPNSELTAQITFGSLAQSQILQIKYSSEILHFAIMYH